jgi:hypothetical protein
MRFWRNRKNGKELAEAKEELRIAQEKRQEVDRAVSQGRAIRRRNHISQDIERAIGGLWNTS